ncbi:MAG: acyltransferase [Maribacter sp.]|nr:acyltransferase [Maribacter sp.]
MIKKLLLGGYGILLYYLRGGVVYARFIGVQVGKGCRIYTRNFGSEPFLISIGDNVTLTLGVQMITHDGSAWLVRDKKGRRYLYQRIVIGNNVFVGANSIIMPGVKIENKVIVAAGSVVTKSIPKGSVVAGIPARIIGSYSEIYDKMKEEYISDIDLDPNKPYKARVLEVTSNSYKKFLK